MLQAIRDRATGWLAWAILIIICIPFALFGVYNYFSRSSEQVVAKVDGTEISATQLDQAYRQQRERLQRLLGKRFNPDLFNESRMKKEALQQLINRQLLLDYLHNQHYAVSNGMLAAIIRSQKAFQQNDKFSHGLYVALLRENGLTPQAYEARVRQTQMSQQLEHGLLSSALVTDAELDRVISIELQKRDLSLLTVPASRFNDQVKVTDTEIKAYYKAHSDEFMSPERVKLAYVELSREAMAQKVDISESDLKARYDEVKATQFSTPEQRQVSHILVAVPKDADKAAVEKARKKIEHIRAQIESGKSFAKLAEEDSQDPGSAKDGGSLGWIEKGQMVPAFDKVAFSLKKDQVSQPVRTQYGFHLIEVTGIRPGGVKPLDQVKEQLLKQMRDEKVANHYYDVGNSLANLVYEHPNSLKPAAAKLGLKIKHTGWITRQGGGSGITSNSDVLKAAFSDDVLLSGQNSAPLDLSKGREVVIRVDAHEAAKEKPLTQVSDQIKKTLVSRKSADKANALAVSLKKEAESGKDLKVLADENKLSFKAAGFVGRGAEGLPQQAIDTAFRLRKPPKGKASYGIAKLPDGNSVVLAVTAVKDGEPSSIDKQRRKRLRDNLASAYGQDEVQALVAALRGKADIKIYKNRL